MDEVFTVQAMRRALAWIDSSTDELIAFLADYVRHLSVNPGRATGGEAGETRSCQTWLRAQLAGFGAFDDLDQWDGAPGQPNLAAVVRGDGGTGSSLMYNGHTDTVGVSPEQRRQWVGGDPWSGQVTGGRLYGRGATDMKAGNAAFVWAARSLRAAGVRPAADLLVTMSIGEETTEAAIGPLSVLDRGYRAALIVNGEPTNLRIAPAGMGWFFFKVTIAGKSLHPAARYRAISPQPEGSEPPGVDAIAKARAVMDAISRLDQHWLLNRVHPLMPPGGMNLGPVSITGGGYRAEMPPSCELVYAVVVSPSMTCAEAMAEVRRTIAAVVAGDEWLRAHPPTIEFPVIHQAMEPIDTALNHPAVSSLSHAFRAALGKEPEYGCLPGPCDANIMAARGETVLIFGPGDLSFGAHGTNEFVPVAHVVAAAKVYAALIVSWCGVAEA